MAKLTRVLILAACFLSAGRTLFATTYYVDYSAGNDSNNGTSKSTPWQYAPGMHTCTSVCSSTTINAGDSIILKGGTTWPNASFMWRLPSGSSGNPVYIGVDKAWYAGSSWTRPIMNAGGAGILNNNGVMFTMGANTTIDNLEITGYYWDSTVCNVGTFGQCVIFNAGQTTGQTWENLYIHGWKHAGTDYTSTSGVSSVIEGGNSSSNVAHDNVITGADVPGDHSMNAFFGAPGTAYNNVLTGLSSGAIVTYAVSYHDNYIEDIGPAYCNEPFPAHAGACSHENGFEDNGDTGLLFYNNVVTNVSAGLAIWIAPNPGYTATMWNNVIYAIHDNQVLNMAPPVYDSTFCSSGKTGNGYCSTAGTYIFENNTVECGDDTTQYNQCQTNVGLIGSGSIATLFLYQNNHFITDASAPGCATGSGAALSCTFAASNVVQTLATATGQGFSSAGAYAFAPTSATSSTVGAGSNLTSSAVGALTTLASDTTYACVNGPGNQPTCPARTTIGRQATGAWNAGAYQSFAPAQPTGLSNTAK